MTANLMISRVCVLLWIQSSRGCFTLLENPVGSLLEKYYRVDEWIVKFGIHRFMVDLWDFGNSHSKKLWLYSPYEWAKDILKFKKHRRKDKKESSKEYQLSHNYVNKNGKNTWKGGKDLETSQAYPKGFGHAIQETFKLHRADIDRHVANLEKTAEELDMSSMPQFAPVEDHWEDAKLSEVLELLM